ncbi:signal transducer and activator of transcription 5B isoform X1 [Biomphalaria glabrata]|nr:signal transducer and activator of transcription 5B isoform X1 [Biomphalaria glabrata]
MDPNKKIKKEKIKLLTLRNVEGTQTLYTQIPFFMRTRLAQMIDSIKWEEIKHGCESYNPRSFQEAKEKFCDVLRKIDEYLEKGRNTKNEVETDSLMLMRTDRNFITVTYGNDPVKFVTAMADCIRKEDELIDHYILEDENTNESTSCIDINVEVSTNNLPVIEQVTESVSQELLDIEKNIDELQKMLTSYNSLIGANSYPLLDEFIFDPDELHSSILNHFDLMLDTMMKYVQVLSMKVAEFRVAKARANVHVGPKAKLDPLAKSFSAFGELLQTVLTWFEPTELLKYFQQNYEEEMKCKELILYQIKIDLLKCNLVVYKQPKDLMSIESVGNKKGKEESSGSDKLKTKRKYRTKKKNTFETGVRLLGGSCLKDVQIDKAFMYLVAERDKAEGKERDQSTVLTFLTEYINDENFPHHVIFKNVAIESFSRVEQNHIYKQFFRLVYDVYISFKGRKMKVQTLSLPFMFNTGSNQILELIAARMWYCANFDLYDGRFHCDDSLDVEIVLKMLADRVANLNPANPRLLYQDEVEFLQTRLPNSSNGKVTMQGFIKDKMKKTRAADQELGFSFHTWFYAVLYCIKIRLLNPWIDGFIYGFCSEATAAELLEKESVGTFILRPSISREINSMSSREACTDLTMDIKLKKDNPSLDENPYFVQSIPILMSSVQKYSLYGAIAGIKKNNEAIAKYCLTRNGKKSIAFLRAYNQGKVEGEYESIKDYRLMVKKMEEIQIKEIGLDTTGNINERNEDAKSGASQRKRPFPGHFTSSSSPTSVCVPAQSPSDASSHWSNTTSTSDPVDMFDQENATFHMSPGSYNVALGLTTASVQGLRSDHQSNCLPVHYDTEHHRYPFLTCLRDSEEEMGHSLQEGYLETCASLILQRIDGTDELSTLLHEYAKSKDAGVDFMDSELIETSPYFNNEATSTQNWLCDRSDEYRKYQYVRTNSNLSSAYSSCTNISSPSDSSLGGMHEECLCISPADSGIDRTTPSPPNEYEGNN